MKLGIPVYEDVDLLDVMGPYEMFGWAAKHKQLDVQLISEDGGPVTSMNGVKFDSHASFADSPQLDVLWVPGGAPKKLGEIMSDPNSPYLGYLKQVAVDAKWVCSVCEGALLLAQAGLLNGHKATTHWAFIKCLQNFPEITVDTTHARFIESGNRLTGGGISSGLDESLKLIELLYDTDTAINVQVSTQYFPSPPVKGKIPDTPPCPVQWS